MGELKLQGIVITLSLKSDSCKVTIEVVFKPIAPRRFVAGVYASGVLILEKKVTGFANEATAVDLLYQAGREGLIPGYSRSASPFRLL